MNYDEDDYSTEQQFDQILEDQTITRHPSSAQRGSLFKKQQITTDMHSSFILGNDDEMGTFDAQDEIEELCEKVTQFEEFAMRLKAQINKIEVVSLKASQTPNVLKMCFAQLKRMMYDENPDFDNQSKMEDSIIDTQKMCNNMIRELNKIKAEYFQITEGIVNKDLNSVRLAHVESQLVKLQNNSEKFTAKEKLFEDTIEHLKQAKERYDQFEQQIFQDKYNDIITLSQNADVICNNISQMKTDIGAILQNEQQSLQEMAVTTKEQRAHYMDFKNQLNRNERKFQKTCNSIDAQINHRQFIGTKETVCEEIALKHGPVEIKNMVQQTKQLEQLIDCQKLYNNQQQKLDLIHEDFKKNQTETNSISKKIQDFQQTLQNGMQEEFQNVGTVVEGKFDGLMELVEMQISRLTSMETKLSEVCISDSSLIYINREIKKNSDMLMNIQNYLHSTTEQINSLRESIQTRQQNQILLEEVNLAKECLKQVDRFENQEYPKIVANIDNLESRLMKQLKNQLNDDNKKSQVLIGKMKKNYELLQKQIENISVLFGDCRGFVENFEDQFENEDMERVNEVEMINERLNEEEENIYGKSQGENEDMQENLENEGQDIDASHPSDDTSLQKMKKEIIQEINQLVSMFNDNNKVIKEQNKNAKTEKALNDLITKNRLIQQNCNSINDKIEDSKNFCKEISDRLQVIVNEEIIDELVKKFKEKNEIITECETIQSKAVTQMEKIDQLISRQMTHITELITTLDKVNPLNNQSSNKDIQEEQFSEQINSKFEETRSLKDEMEDIKSKLDGFVDEIENIMQPLNVLNEREVKREPEISQILQKMKQIDQELTQLETSINPNTQKIQKQQKTVKTIMEGEITRKLQKSQESIEQINGVIENSGETKSHANKRLKVYKDLIEKAIKKQGQTDPFLNDKLVELKDEALLFDKDLGDSDSKLRDQLKKCSEAKKAVFDIDKEPEKYLPHQMDNMLTNLDEIEEKVQIYQEKIANTDKTIKTKIEELQKLLESSDSKKEMLALIEELSTDINEDLGRLADELDKYPDQLDQIEETLEQMQKSIAAGDDYHEISGDITKYLTDLEMLKNDLGEMEEALQNQKNGKDDYKNMMKKSSTIDSLKKVVEFLQKAKDNVINVFTDLHDWKEELNELKTKLNDCDITKNISKRKNEMRQFGNKLDMMLKEFENLKKSQINSLEVKKKMTKIEQTLTSFKNEKSQIDNLMISELETMKPVDFVDFSKNNNAIKKVREVRNKIKEAETSMKDLEKLQKEVVRKIAEHDMENSIILQGNKALKLLEQLKDVDKRLKLVQKSGEELDGNTSNGDEDEFIEALKKEMPEVLENISYTFTLLKDVDKLLIEVKHSMDVDTMTGLQDKNGQAGENVDEAEALLNQLEQEIFNLNASKKLQNRDIELEGVHTNCHQILEELTQEKTDALVEIDKNREKQEENRDQEMVDKDGNKVDIMEDLVRLESQLQAYVKEITVICDDIKTLEAHQQVCFEEFTAELPKQIIDIRKTRQTAKPQKNNLKRPAQFLQKGDKKKGGEDQSADVFAWISLNCKYRGRVKNLLNQLKEIQGSRKALEDKYAEMRREVFKIKQIKLYKPVKGDAVDEMFAGYLNKAKLEIEVQRISASNYMFGTKKILAKIINDRLVIRVGGGYMNAEEFIEQYASIEMLKIQKIEESKNDQGFAETKRDTQNIQRRPGVVQNNLNTSSRGTTGIARPQTSLALAQQAKDALRQTLVAQATKGNEDQLKQSLRNTNRLKDPRASANVYQSQDLTAALKDMKQGNKKTAEPGFSRRQTILPGTLTIPKEGVRASTALGGTSPTAMSARAPQSTKNAQSKLGIKKQSTLAPKKF